MTARARQKNAIAPTPSPHRPPAPAPKPYRRVSSWMEGQTPRGSRTIEQRNEIEVGVAIARFSDGDPYQWQ